MQPFAKLLYAWNNAVLSAHKNLTGEEYWEIVGNFSSSKGTLNARLISFDGKKLEKLSISNHNYNILLFHILAHNIFYVIIINFNHFKYFIKII